MAAQRYSRRTFLKAASAGAGAAFFYTDITRGKTVESAGWQQVPNILKRIKPPVFPEQDFDVTEFGAVGNGTADCTEAFKRAIKACHKAGGGRVRVPKGVFLTGAIHLKSNVNLHIVEDATLLFSRDTSSYLPLVFSRWEGMELMNYSPFIYAFEEENIAVTGKGTIDGQANCQHWWPWKGRTECGWQEGEPRQHAARDQLMKMVEQGVPVEERKFGEGYYLRPQFIQPYRCENVLIEGITLKNSPMWEIHPVLCQNVTVRGVTVESHGPNNDGCNPESCTDVLIEDCYFDTGDDCIAIKSGRNADGRRIDTPCKNVVIRNCTMKDGHGGVVMGSEISGSVRNVFAENCQMDSPHLERMLRIKTNSLRGGTVENVYMRNINVGQVSGAVVRVNFMYEEGDVGPYKPEVRNIEVRDIRCEDTRRALYIRGYEDSPIQNIRLINATIAKAPEPNVLEHVQDLQLSNVRINGKLHNKTITT